MVAPRKLPPSSGWRKILYSGTFQRINLGESPAERHHRELRTRIRRHIRKQYVIGFVSGKGGVGKTTMTASIGGVFRECRPENVVAIDAAPGFGTLAGRIDESPPGDYTAVLEDTDVQGYAELVSHSVVILNDSRNNYESGARSHLTEHFTQRGATVEFMPFDPHLAQGGIIDTRHELRPKTRLRLFEIAATLADKYIPDADRPR